MNEQVFQYSDYVAFLKVHISANNSVRGYQARLASAAGCHTSYFSRVLGETVVLTADQAANIATFLQMSPEQTDYFLVLVALARAASPALKRVLERQLADLSKNSKEISTRLSQSKKVIGTENGIYYSAWYYSAVHMLLMVPGYKSAEKIAQRLGIPLELAKESLEVLSSLKIAEKKGDQWLVNEVDLHISNRVFWSSIYHSNWRQRAAFRIMEKKADDIHFTALHAMSRKDFEALKEILRRSIQDMRTLIAASREEDVFAVSMDAYCL